MLILTHTDIIIHHLSPPTSHPTSQFTHNHMNTRPPHFHQLMTAEIFHPKAPAISILLRVYLVVLISRIYLHPNPVTVRPRLSAVFEAKT